MYRVAIIDDEPLAVQYIEGLISWEKFGCRVAWTANTAAKAMDLLNSAENYPDIVFVDIRMPDKDGIFLSKKMIAVNQKCKIIIITAYRDFDAAKSAITLGVFDFVLKHELDKGKLTQLMEDVTKSMALEKAADAEKIAGAVKKYFLGKPVDTEVLPRHHRFFLCILQFSPIAAMVKCSYPDITSLKAGNSEDVFQPVARGELSDSEAFVLFTREGRSISQKNDYSHSNCALRHLAEELEKISKVSFHIFVSDCTGGRENLRRVCGEMKKYLSVGYVGRKKIMNCGYSRDFTVTDTFGMEDEIKKACRLIEHGEFSVASDIVSAVGQQLLSKGDCFLSDTGFLSDLLEVLGRCCRKKLLGSLGEYMAVNGRIVGLADAFGRIHEVLTFLSGAAVSPNQQNDRRLLKAIEFISRHYAEPITTGSMAEELGISEGYLRSIFMDTLHTSFKDYLQKYRIEAAKKMLCSESYKIYEISYQCGFKTSQHFCRVFKQHTGVTPLEYTGTLL